MEARKFVRYDTIRNKLRNFSGKRTQDMTASSSANLFRTIDELRSNILRRGVISLRKRDAEIQVSFNKNICTSDI